MILSKATTYLRSIGYTVSYDDHPGMSEPGMYWVRKGESDGSFMLPEMVRTFAIECKLFQQWPKGLAILRSRWRYSEKSIDLDPAKEWEVEKEMAQ